MIKPALRLTCFLLLIAAPLSAAPMAVRPERESGVYATGETVCWNLDTTAWPTGVKNLHYRIKTGGQKQIKEGNLELAEVLPNPVLVDGGSGNPSVVYQTIIMDNICGTQIHGQIARPAVGAKFPAMLLVQYAGVYALDKGSVVNQAAAGWLCLNIQARDMDVTRTESYYRQLAEGSPKEVGFVPPSGHGGPHDAYTVLFNEMARRDQGAADSDPPMPMKSQYVTARHLPVPSTPKTEESTTDYPDISDC